MSAPGASAAAGRTYLAMVRRLFWRRRLNRLASWIVASIFFLAAGADLLASERPLLLHLEGETWVLPNLTDPPELRIYDNQLLLKEMGPEDWAVFPPIPYGYATHDLDAVLAPPGPEHWLGTDPSGRDVLARLLHGSRVSLAVGLVAVTLLVGIGLLLGCLAGFYGGWIDATVMRVVEVFLSIPSFLIIVTLLAVLAPEGWGAVLALMVVIGLTGWTSVARLVRAEILKVKTQEFVLAARALGSSDLRLILRHLLPNALAPVLVAATFSVAASILIEGALSFLGFGIPPDMASWGGMLTEARRHFEAWWLAIFPGLAIFITVTAYNLLGEGLRDAIDPKLKA
ncbi:MAG: ABC transporter permease [Deltaproteobacteria bacterium]|nr:ABC transporter permease [Deltaproteobacteria bacterium]